MGALLKRKPAYTLEEYFDLESTSEVKYEYCDGDIVCMSGGSANHAELCSNIHELLKGLARKKGGRAYTENFAVKTTEWPPYRYPDASVACNRKTEKIGGATTITNPTILVEVVSPESEHVDKNQKRAAYQAIETLREYLIIEQDRPEILLYLRDEAGVWQLETITGLDAHFFLPSLETRVEMRDVYENVDFSEVSNEDER